ncbi:Chaoptin [Halotydeus destructor]|nr:Chaoptin [Halotydeus destructor]
MAEVLCYNVPLTRMPTLPTGHHFYRVNIIAAKDVYQLTGGTFGQVTISALTISHSKLDNVHEDAFVGTEDTLTTVDFGHNKFRTFPRLPLQRLPNLQWLSLKGNQIEGVKPEDFVPRPVVLEQVKNSDGGELNHHHDPQSDPETLDMSESQLRTLFLSDNALSFISDQVFSSLKNLQNLDLSGNTISKIEGKPFPSSLTSLSLSNNLLSSVPVSGLSNLKNLKWLQLRGNVIRQLPQNWFLPVRQLDILDLSKNLMASLAVSNFVTFDDERASYIMKRNVNSSLVLELDTDNVTESPGLSDVTYIRDLLLDFNLLQSLPGELFKGLSVQRLSLSNNMLSTLPSNLFIGPTRDDLRALDLNFNVLTEIPEAVSTLARLTSLLLKGNQLEIVHENSFTGSKDYLQSLDLSSNLLTKVPSDALSRTVRLLRLNLQENQIRKIGNTDFGRWSAGLLSVSLSKNNLQVIEGNAFRHLDKLRELKVSYNDIVDASPEALLPLRQSLEILEISYAISSAADKVVMQSVSILDRLQWLELDHNRLTEMSPRALSRLPSLQHCDLEGNSMMEVPSGLFDPNVHSSLKNIILSNNKLSKFRSRTFSGLQQVVNIVATGNRLHSVENGAFADLPLLRTVILSRNRIGNIERGSFQNVTQLTHLFLQQNKLKSFSLDIIDNQQEPELEEQNDYPGLEPEQHFTTSGQNLYINVSHNEITTLHGPLYATDGTSGPSGPSVRVLDVSHNHLSRISVAFMDNICPELRLLHLNHNRLTLMPVFALSQCEALQILSLSGNAITGLFQGSVPPNETIMTSSLLPELQVLDLSLNHIANISLVFRFPMAKLRLLDLSSNRIEHLQVEAFANLGSLEILNLSGNKLNQLDNFNSAIKCLGVAASLRQLDLTDNYLSRVEQVNSCDHLEELNVSGNELFELHEDTFSGLKHLRRLDLSSNQLRKISQHTFHPLQRLRQLVVNNCSLAVMPNLPLVDMVKLIASNNLMANISSQSLAKARALRSLDLSGNQLADIPRTLWRHLASLSELNLSSNPIEVIDAASFSELRKLHNLDISRLRLKFVDSRMLHSLVELTALRTSTYPNVRSFRLHDLLARSVGLKSVHVHIQESTLSHQIQWAFSSKLTELSITGSSLVKILPDAFLGLRSSDLVLRITDTNVSHLPAGLLRYMNNRFALIDLRRNRLTSLNPNVLQFPTSQMTNKVQGGEMYKAFHTFHVSGGLLLDENPWQCSCDLIWLSSWLRKWLRETRKYYMLNLDVFLHQTQSPLQGTCIRYLANNSVSGSLSADTFGIHDQLNVSTMAARRAINIPLIDLYAETVSCNGAHVPVMFHAITLIISLSHFVMELLSPGAQRSLEPWL